ncbi:MAG TPA: DUF2007 domain-containing protein [Actinomycetota bacterium]|nr:DUF2007 domain-containing protein [Actinomycetota bacterium]
MDRYRSDVGYRYCPECRAEYRPGFEICADCGVHLVYELPPEHEPPPAPTADEPRLGPHPVAVFASGRDTDAEIVRGVLASCGIPARVWSSGYEAYLGRGTIGQLTGARGGFAYRVMVPAEDAEAAREIIAAEPEAGDPLPE